MAIGRKNYVFAGSHEAAQRAAMVYFLLATCRLHQINPYEWLKDVLERMHFYTTANIHELLPQCWKKITAYSFFYLPRWVGRWLTLLTVFFYSFGA